MRLKSNTKNKWWQYLVATQRLHFRRIKGRKEKRIVIITFSVISVIFGVKLILYFLSINSKKKIL